MADKELSGFISCWKVGSKPVTRRKNHTIHSSSWKQASRIRSYLYLKDKMQGEVLCGETTFQSHGFHRSISFTCSPVLQPHKLLKAALSTMKIRINLWKKKLKLHPRCLKAGLKPTQNGLISVSPQLSCPSVKDREAPSLPTVSVKTNFCLWIPQDSPSEVINNSLLSERLSRALNVGVRMAHSGELLGGAPSSLGITGKCGPWGTAELAQVIKGVC